MIQAINVNKIYSDGAKELRVLKDINLKIKKGEFAAITGPSGAGKSTLLHILGGLDAPSSGSVIFDETGLYETPDILRAKIRNTGIGFVFQFYHLLPEFNVLENVLMPALINKKTKAEGLVLKERAKEILSKVGLSERITHKPSQLSGGEQQRAAIARALINSPKALLCDEPTGNLDSKTGGEVVEILAGLNKNESVTCVMVTHEEALAKAADRILRMVDGGIS